MGRHRLRCRRPNRQRPGPPCEEKLSEWTGTKVDDVDVERIIATDTKFD